MKWKFLWGLLITVLVLGQFFCIGKLAIQLKESDTMLKVYDGKHLYEQNRSDLINAQQLKIRQQFIERYLDAVTKGNYLKTLKEQPYNIYDDLEGEPNETK